MAVTAQSSNAFRGRWVATWSIPAATQVVLSLWLGTAATFGSAAALFWIVVIAALPCIVASLALVARSFGSEESDLGFLGLFFYSVSVLALVHGITTPGVLFETNTSTMTSVLLSIPIGLVAISPSMLPRRRRVEWLRRRWKAWIVGWSVAITWLAGVLLVNENLFPAPTPREPFAVAVGGVSFLGCVLLSRRHLRMARISGQAGPLMVSAGLGLVGSSAFVWLSTNALSVGFWSAHVLDIAGVLGSTVGAAWAYRHTREVRGVLAPVLVVEPAAALEIGLDPIVHRFVADLEVKDQITRDHVVRTAGLAIRVAEELRVASGELGRIGLTALLHDVGKLNVPDEILNKPGRLTEAEFEIIRAHPVDGEQLVSTSAALVEISAGIRGHHERVDGGGYPDGLAGDAIPRDARIVAVCDAYDAMANARQYRDGMGSVKAIAVLNEHAGTQWDAVVVAALVAVVRGDPPTGQAVGPLGQVGRLPDGGSRRGMDCDCLPEMAPAE